MMNLGLLFLALAIGLGGLTAIAWLGDKLIGGDSDA